MRTSLSLLLGALIITGVGLWLSKGRTESSAASPAPVQYAARSPDQAESRALSTPPLVNRASDKYVVMPGRAIDVEAQLRDAATAGNADAAFKIYLKLNQCSDPMVNGVSEQELAMYRKAGVSTKTLESTASKLRSECEGAQQLVAERGQWLDKAASGGLEEAQKLFAADPNAILGTSDVTKIDPAAADAYAERSEGYMTALAQTGDVDAMLSLSLMYKASEFTPRDPVRSAAYRLAAEGVAPLQIRPQPIEMTMRGLSSREQAEVTRLAREIRSLCCKN
ncbi:TPA: hypothetical protein ACKPZV_004343 [Stenotrophomonas maltophilia]